MILQYRKSKTNTSFKKIGNFNLFTTFNFDPNFYFILLMYSKVMIDLPKLLLKNRNFSFYKELLYSAVLS